MPISSFPVPPAVMVLRSYTPLEPGTRLHLDMSPDPAQDASTLIALEGKLRLTGILGRLMQPFLRL